MSHGGGGGGSGEVSADPNLTPLLDLVLQLVMFFMLVTHFVTEELSDRIKLPIATQAKPLTAKDTNFMYLNVDKTGKVIVAVGDPLTSDAEIKTYLRLAARNHIFGEKKAYDEVTVIIRADRDARFTHIHRTMMAIKAVGFKKLQLRAELPGGVS
jgi:biopolymer transport protein ExbD